jgi:prepilin-type N-terminal cleavage/methylation domain-containing protein/prepilin-type processing-associated H-X9-DG protein
MALGPLDRMNQFQDAFSMLEGNKQQRRLAFSLIELLVVVVILAILAGLLLPVLANAKARSQSIYCLNNEKQLSLACLMYAGDFDDRLPYNLGAAEIKQLESQKRFLNWSTPVMSWELDPHNTNIVQLTAGGIGPYVGFRPRVYRCPCDSVVSDIQAAAGWANRVRSISMNAMVGDAGQFSRTGANINNPDYRQFFKQAHILQPSKVFVFVEEHPDSINDGYFLNHPDSLRWMDLPASYHRGSANLSYADGHLESHRWHFSSTQPPARPDAVRLPLSVPLAEREDFDWLMERTSVDAEQTLEGY